MTSSEERMQILTMLQEGQISVEEATQLLAALSAPTPAPAPEPAESVAGGRWLNVQISDIETGRQRVQVRLPLNLVDVALKMGARLVPAAVSDARTRLEIAMAEGRTGQIVDMVNEEGNERIEVFIS